VTDLDAESNALTAIITFCHLLHLLYVLFSNSVLYDNRTDDKKQVLILIISKKCGKQKNLQKTGFLYKLKNERKIAG